VLLKKRTFFNFLLYENQSQDADCPDVPGEVLELALLDKVHEPFESDDAEDE
jgi:hypothetical protein